MYPNGIPGPFLRGSYFGFGFKRLDPATDGTRIRESEIEGLQPDLPWALDATTDSFYIWNGILTAYTKCSLTEKQDKLVAISAISKQFQPILKDEYIAGLWRRHLAQHLLWKVLSPRNVVSLPTDSEDYCAPSWSWASLTGEISPYYGVARRDKPVMIKLLEVKVENRTADPRGEVSGGHIKLRGWLKHFPPPQNVDSVLWRFNTPGDGTCFVDPDRLPIPTDPKWYCLPVLETVTKYDGREYKKVIGLILLETGRENEYKRIGIFDTLGKVYKFFKRPTYPFRTVQNLEDTGSPMPGNNSENRVSDSRFQVYDTAAETDQNNISTPAKKRRPISSFFSRKVSEEGSKGSKRREPRNGMGEQWRFGWRKNQWVERVITIV